MKTNNYNYAKQCGYFEGLLNGLLWFLCNQKSLNEDELKKLIDRLRSEMLKRQGDQP